MHKKGRRATTQVIRDDQVIRSTSADFYDYHQSGIQQGRQEGTYQLLPGDAFKSACYYESNDVFQSFGVSSQDEMCMTTLRYYPRRKLFGVASLVCAYNLPMVTPCQASHTESSLDSSAEMGRTFGVPASSDTICLAPPPPPVLDSNPFDVSPLDSKPLDGLKAQNDDVTGSSASGLGSLVGFLFPLAVLVKIW